MFPNTVIICFYSHISSQFTVEIQANRHILQRATLHSENDVYSANFQYSAVNRLFDSCARVLQVWRPLFIEIMSYFHNKNWKYLEISENHNFLDIFDKLTLNPHISFILIVQRRRLWKIARAPFCATLRQRHSKSNGKEKVVLKTIFQGND